MDEVQVLTKMQSLIYNTNFKKCLEDTTNQDITLFLGNTRSGKSTTVNYVIGNALKSVKDGRKKYKIYNATEVFHGPKIGRGSISETTVPTAWNSSKVSGLVVDAPGFDDNRGVAQDVANAFHIKQLIENIRSIKIVIIVDIFDILNDNINSFIGLFNKMHDMFPETQKLKNGMLIVFTKDNEDTNIDEIRETMKEKVIDQTALEIKNRELITFFIENRSHVVIVKMPEAEGIISEENGIFRNLISAIENNTSKLNSESLNGISFGISDKSRTFLLQAQTNLLEFAQFNIMLSSTGSAFGNYLNQNVGTFHTLSRGNEIANWLNDLEVKLNAGTNSQGTVKDLLNHIKNILPNSNVLSDLNSFNMKLDFIAFLDQILHRSYSATLKENVRNLFINMKRTLMDHKNNVRIKILELQEVEERNRLAREEAAHAERMKQERARQVKLEQEQEALRQSLRQSMQNMQFQVQHEIQKQSTHDIQIGGQHGIQKIEARVEVRVNANGNIDQETQKQLEDRLRQVVLDHQNTNCRTQ